MRSRLNRAWLLMLVALQFMLGLSPAMAARTRNCNAIYEGFAQCLLALGESMSNSIQSEESNLEIDTICRSWDEFYTCASKVLAGCPEEAKAVWDSLQQESKKMQFSDNLYDICANRAQPITPAQSSPAQAETNQESLKGHAHPLAPALPPLLPPLLPACLSLLALLAVM